MEGTPFIGAALYTYWKRGMPPPQMTILNAPIRDACVARRERTNTPTQALLLLNEGEYLKAARSLAQKALEAESKDEPKRLAFVYETVTSKLPDEKERQVLSDLVRNLQKNYLEQPAAGGCDLPRCEDGRRGARRRSSPPGPCLVNALYNLDITKTRE